MKRQNLVREYMDEWQLYGGEMMQRKDIIRDLRAIAPNRQCVDMYLCGLDSAMERMVGAYCDLATGEERR
jgi:hypothetical protein